MRPSTTPASTTPSPTPPRCRNRRSARIRPIIIGGGGAKRTPALAARFADEFNIPFVPLDTLTEQYARVAAAVENAGRPADSLTYSAAFVVCVGRDDAEITRRADAIGREVDELRSNSPMVGTPEEVADKLGPFLQAGVQRVYLQVLDMSDLDHVEFIAERSHPPHRLTTRPERARGYYRCP